MAAREDLEFRGFQFQHYGSRNLGLFARSGPSQPGKCADGTSRSKVSSAEMDCVGRSGMTGLSSPSLWARAFGGTGIQNEERQGFGSAEGRLTAARLMARIWLD
jgi:hypothetical protein